MKNKMRMAVLALMLMTSLSMAACDTAGTQSTEATAVAGEVTADSGMTAPSDGEMPSFGEGEMPAPPDGTFGGRGGHGGGRGERPSLPEGEMPSFGDGQMPGGPGGMPGGMAGGQQSAASAESPSEIVTTSLTSTASQLAVDESAAETIVMSEDNAQVTIDEAGTYLVTGACSDGNITVKKGTTGVVLILKDLDLTSTTGATVSCNKDSQVKIVIEGSVKLTDAEDPADEDSADAEVADAFDGAALKIKDGADVCLTGSGTLTIDASSCKNGIKSGDENEPVFVIDGDLTIDITAANDGINAGYDLTILSGTIVVKADDDGIHADRILTIGSEDGSGPDITVNAEEGLEGTIVNLFGGTGTVNASDDSVNAANKENTYASELTFSINITGGTWEINCSGGDGLDSNGDINITGGQTTVTCGRAGAGEGGVDWVGSLYYEEECLTNNSGFAYDAMPQR